MTRAVVSGFAGSDWEKIASLTWPQMDDYANRVGADFLSGQLTGTGRPLSWSKLISIADALASYDEVLWLDTDVSVGLASKDVFQEVPAGESVAMSWLVDPRGVGHFNCGVMIVRRSALRLLMLAAMRDECILHPWWEQQAINAIASEMPWSIFTLGEEWNSWPGTPASVTPQFRHACGGGSCESRIQWLSKGAAS